MKTFIQFGIKILATVFFLGSLASAQGIDPVLSTDDVVAKMLEHDAQRESQLSGYTATRHYLVVHKRSRAEMKVELTCAGDGVKEFKILSESGSFAIRTLVFHRMLNEETEASRPETRKITRITPSNYAFRLIGQDVVDGHPAYVLQVAPRHKNKYLIDGRIWVDADDYSIVRIEGRPARNPSFWTRSVHFIHTYQKVGPFWLAASTHSVSEIRIYRKLRLRHQDRGKARPNDRVVIEHKIDDHRSSCRDGLGISVPRRPHRGRTVDRGNRIQPSVCRSMWTPPCPSGHGSSSPLIA